MAKALLAEGFLEEADWDAERGLVDSVMGGLHRWLTRQSAEEQKYFRLELAFTDDIGQWGLNNSEWRRVDTDPATGHVGAFALIMQHDVVEVPLIGEEIERLETLARGAGYSVLRALYSGLYPTIGAWTPGSVVDWMENDWYEMEQEAAEEPWGVTQEEFFAVVPETAVTPAWNQRAINRAKKQLLGRDGDHTIFYLAEELHAVRNAWKKAVGPQDYENEMCFFSGERLYPIVLDWKLNSPITTIFDDWQEMVQNCGEWTNVLWMQGFLSNVPEQVRQAARQLRYAVRLVSLCDTLLACLDNRREAEEQAKETVRERIQVTL